MFHSGQLLLHLCAVCIICTLARPSIINHRHHSGLYQVENGENNLQRNANHDRQTFVNIKNCNLRERSCSGHGICVKIGKHVAKCSCNDGYFGARCEIEPVQSLQCTFNRAFAARPSWTCPPEHVCVPQDFTCFLGPCPDASGYCLPETRMHNRA